MTIDELMDKFDLDWLEVDADGVYIHAGRALRMDEWRELCEEIEGMQDE